MMPNIVEKIEQARGCGYRKGGGLYLVSGGEAGGCGKLPVPLTSCPCCGEGVKQSRGFTWISTALFANEQCMTDTPCGACVLSRPNTKIGLLWVGEKFYPNSAAFSKESAAMGISKRISQVPNDLVVGQTWIALAHPKACKSVSEGGDIELMPGVFSAFIPQRVEYVIKGDETEEELERMEKRGITLVKVIRDIDNDLFK